MKSIPSLLILCLTAALHAATPPQAKVTRNPDDVPEGLAKSDWQGIRAAYEAGRHAFQSVDGGWQARNPGQQWTTKFDGRGFLTTPESGGWSWGLELESEADKPVRADPLFADKSAGNKLIFPRSAAITEWFINDQRGLEQGWTLSAPAEIRLRVRGSLKASVSAQSISFGHITYSGLKAWDATGKTVPTHFEATTQGFAVRYDDSGAQYPITIDPIAQQAYLKPSNTTSNDQFGFSVAISGDTAVVGASGEDSNATGVNGDEINNLASAAGAVYVFVRNNGAWTQQAYLKASNTDADDRFGSTVAISGDTLVIGAEGEDSNATTVNGDGTNNLASDAGAVYVFVRNNGVWTQQAYLKASNTGAGDAFGTSVALSADTVMIGAQGEDSNATTVNGNGSDNSTSDAGAAYVFVRNNGVWTQQAYLKAANSGVQDLFGKAVAVSGETALIGASGENSNATGVNGDGANNTLQFAGAAYIFVRNNGVWTQQAYLKASNTDAFDSFGAALALSGDTAIVAAFREDSNATGVNGDQTNNVASNAGAAYVFVRNNGAWTQQAYLKASNAEAEDYFGTAIAVSGDSAVIAASDESSNAVGIGGSGANNNWPDSGAAYVFTRSGTTWTQSSYLKASNTGFLDRFGSSVAMSGSTIIVGAPFEDSSATGVNGNQADDSASGVGAAYVFSVPPTVAAISPNSGSAAGGTSVTITGNNFSAPATVTINNVPATNVVVSNSTTITCTTPAGTAGSASVLVTTAGGTNAANSLFTYLPPPTISSISPTSGSTAGGTAVTILGANLTGATSVTFRGTPATSFSVIHSGRISAVTPALSAGTASVLITTPNGTNAANSLYTYATPPTVASISPTTGTTAGGTSVTITGTNFTGATGVSFGGTAATSFTVDSATQITALTPARPAGAASVVVTNPGGSNAPNSLYTYVAPPAVTGISPSSGTTLGGTNVTITGTGFTGATSVMIGGVAASINTVTPTAITATTAARSAGTANVVVTNNIGSGTGTNLYTYILLTPGDLDPLNANIVGITVLATAVQPDGKMIVGGNFTQAFGAARQNIARLNADGTLDSSFDPKANGAITSIALQQDGKILMGGIFTTLQPNGAASATTRNRIARLNVDGTLDTSFDPNANSGVNSIAVQADGKVLIGGAFNTLQPNGAASATTRNRIARLNATGTLDSSFDPNANDEVLGLAVQADGKVIVSGRFTSLQSNGAASATTRSRVARVNADGTLDASFNPNADGVVNALALQADGKVLLGGLFTSVGGTTRNRIARVNADGTLDTGFNPNANSTVTSMALQANGKVLIGGAFTSLQPNGAASATTIKYAARVNADGTLDAAFNPNADNDVYSVALQADGMVLLGGYFSALQPNGAPAPSPRNFFARVANDAATQTITTPDNATVLWTRDGAGPALIGASFETSTNGGSTWTALVGTVARVGTTANWTLTGTDMPTSGHIRARGRTAGGYYSGSSGVIEQISAYTAPVAPPAVTGITPATGSTSGGTSVTITGSGFTGVTSVTIGGAPATSVSLLSPSSISAVTPARPAGAASVLVTTPAGTNAANTLYTFGNTVPTISDVTDKSTNEDTATTSIAFTVNDSETAAASLVVTASSSNTTLVPNANLVLGGSGSSRTLVATPAANLSGTTIITLSVTDNGSLTATDSFTLTVAPVNDVPSFTKGADQMRPLGTTAVQTVSGWATALTDGDAEVSQALTFNVSVVSGGSIFSSAPAISSEGTLTYTLNGTTAGTASLSVTLTDDATAGGAALTSAAQTFTITVDPIAPGAPVIGTAIRGNASARVAFSPPASNGGSAITSYTATASPGGFTGSGTTSPVTVSGLTNGTAYTFTVTATNITGTGPASAASNAVTPLPPPTLTQVSPASGSELGGTTVTITGAIFNDASSVTIGGVAATLVNVSATSITAITPAGSAGLASVVITTPSGSNAENTAFRYLAPTTTTLASSQNPSFSYSSPTFTARVTSAQPEPTGQMKLFINDVLFESKAVDATGTATFTPPPAISFDDGTRTSVLAVGTHKIQAVFEAGGDVLNSTSTALNQTVRKTGLALTLGALSHVYDGTGKTATATINGLPDLTGVQFDFTYNGSAALPINAGSYDVVASINDPSLEGNRSGTLVITKAPLSFTLTSPTLVYDGTPRVPDLTFTSAGASITLTYQSIVNGVPTGATSSTAPIFPGHYLVTVATSSPNYDLTGTTAEFEVVKGQASLFVLNTEQMYDGTALVPDVLTEPLDLPISLTYQLIVDGILTGPVTSQAPTAVGRYQIFASSPNYDLTPSKAELRISRRTLSISIKGLEVTADGQPKPVTVTTTPADVPVIVTYHGGGTSTTTAPSAAPAGGGSWRVEVDPADTSIYDGTASGQLVFSSRRPPIITLRGPAVSDVSSEAVFTAIVWRNGGAAAPTGNVYFYRKENDELFWLFNGRIDGGKVMMTTDQISLPGRTTPYTLVAEYYGDENYQSAVSDELLTTRQGKILANNYSEFLRYTGQPAQIPEDRLKFLNDHRNAVASYEITYNGSTTLPTNATSSPARIEVVYQTHDEETYYDVIDLSILKEYARVRISSLYQSLVPGGSYPVQVTTDPPGLATTVTYNGVNLPNGPTAPGTYSVQADIVDQNYERYSLAEASGTLVVAQNSAKFSVNDLVQNYDGNRKRVHVSATPDIPFDITYNGASSEPVAPGIYEVKVTPRNQDVYGTGSSETLVIKARVVATVNGQPNNTHLRFNNGRGGQLSNFPAFVEPNQNEWKLQFVDSDELRFERWSDGSRENPRKVEFGRSSDPASYVFNAEASPRYYLKAQTIVAPNLPPRSGGGAIGDGWYAVGELAKFDAAKWGEGAVIDHWEYAGKPLNPADGHVILRDGREVYIKVRADGGNPVCYINHGYIAEGYNTGGYVDIRRKDYMFLAPRGQRFVPNGVNYEVTAIPWPGYIFYQWGRSNSANFAMNVPYRSTTEEFTRIGSGEYSAVLPRFIKNGPEFRASIWDHKREHSFEIGGVPIVGIRSAMVQLSNTGKYTDNIRLKRIRATGFRIRFPRRNDLEPPWQYYYPFSRNEKEIAANRDTPMSSATRLMVLFFQPVSVNNQLFNFLNPNFITNLVQQFEDPPAVDYFIRPLSNNQSRDFKILLAGVGLEYDFGQGIQAEVQMTLNFETPDGPQVVDAWWMDMTPDDPQPTTADLQ
jgi:uncharacterized delta-60 repeat protein